MRIKRRFLHRASLFWSGTKNELQIDDDHTEKGFGLVVDVFGK